MAGLTFDGTHLWTISAGTFPFLYKMTPDGTVVESHQPIYQGNPLSGSMAGLTSQPGIPPPEPVPVGGEAYPVNKLSILTPWLTLALLLALGGGVLVLKRRQAS